MAFRHLIPDLVVQNVAHIDMEELKKAGILAMVIDVDNTVARDNWPDLEPFAKAFIKKAIEEGFIICFISNNRYERIKGIVADTGCPGIGRAGKPSPKAYRKVFELTGTSGQNTAAIGDQLFTDILGANKAGLFSILVNPIHKKEILRIKVKRPFEKMVLGIIWMVRKIAKGRQNG